MNPETPEDGEAFAAITRIVEQRDALREMLYQVRSIVGCGSVENVCGAVQTLQTRYDDALARIATIERDSTKLRDTLQSAIACLVVCADDLEMADLPHASVRTDIADYQAVLETCCPVKPEPSAADSSLTRPGAS